MPGMVSHYAKSICKDMPSSELYNGNAVLILASGVCLMCMPGTFDGEAVI